MLGKLFNLSAGTGANGASNGGYAAASPEPVSSLESVQEDVHTRSLLYPEAQALLQHRYDQVSPLPTSPNLPISSLTSAFDVDADLDLDRRDIRVLVLQDGLGSTIPSCVLYDSQSPPPAPAPILPDRPSTMAGLSHINLGSGMTPDASRRVPPTSPRKPSLGSGAHGGNRPAAGQPDSPQFRQSATFDRRPPLHSRSQSRLETDAQRAYREYTDEVSVYLNCVFGNSELIAYRGTSTKVHVLPSEPASRPDPSAAMFHDGRGSLGRSSMRSSKLSQSFSSESAAMFPQNPASISSSSVATGYPRSPDRRRVLITRLFPVPLAGDDDTPAPPPAPSTAPSTAPTTAPATPHSRVSEDGSYPFPPYSEDGTYKQKRKAQSKQKRTPMYAIALIISLPQPPPPSMPVSSAASRTTFRGSSSYPDQDSCSSSYGSSRKATFNGLGIDMSTPDSGTATAVSSSILSGTTDFEERMDPITQRWDVIMRTFNQMQNAVTVTVSGLLRNIDLASPVNAQPSPTPATISRNASLSGGRRSEDGLGLGLGGIGAPPMKPAKTTAKLISLSPNSLAGNERIDRQAEIARMRISVGLRALRVVTGQNRWGIWRDEARWLTRWASSVRDQQLRPPVRARLPLPLQQQQQPQDEFLYSLLTAFLATHTDWLQALSPRRYRKRHMLLQNTQGNDSLLPSRTVIVSQDKAAARRIIFLLSAFLPMTQSSGNTRAHRPSTSMSWGALSQSPPASFFQSNTKEEPLRRKINRRTGSSRHRSAHTRTLSLQGPAGGVSSQRSASISEAGIPSHLVHLNMHKSYHERRPSDTASIRTANLPISGNDFNTQKSSAAMSTMLSSDAAIPHFATMQRTDSLVSRPDSIASSAAADDLKRTLKRGDSNASQQSLTILPPQQPGSGPTSPTMRPDSRNSGSLWGSMLTSLLSGRRRDTPNLGRFGGHSRSSSASSWDPLGRHGSLPPSSPTKFRHGINELQQQQPPPSPLYQQQAPQQTGHLQAQQSSLYGQRPKTTGSENQPRVAAKNVPQNHLASTAATSDEGIDPHTPRLSQYDNPSVGAGAEQTTGNKSGSSQTTPELSNVLSSPVKMSVNAEDGVIDVEFPFPEYMRSFETAVSSPSSSGFLPAAPAMGGGGLDGFEQSFRSSIDSDVPANVAGWLQAFHPDFAIQAIPPEPNLLNKVKESLRAEPSPSVFAFGTEASEAQQSSERWLDVSSAIIVDTSRLAITRICYSRLVRPKIVTPSSPAESNNSRLPPVATTTVPSMQEVQIDEKFVEEQITSMDSSLTTAIERVIAQVVSGGSNTGAAAGTGSGGGISIKKPVGSGTSADGLSSSLGLNNSLTSANSALSTNSSRSPSVRRGRSNSASGGSDDPRLPRLQLAQTSSTPPFSPVLPIALEEVPRSECKAVLLSALKYIVRDVIKGREAEVAGEGDAVPPTDARSILKTAVAAWVDKVDRGEV